MPRAKRTPDQVMRDAQAKLAGGGLLSPDEIAAITPISRRTFYRLPFFRTRLVRVSPGRVGVAAEDVRLYLQLQRGAPADTSSTTTNRSPRAA